MMMMLMMMIGIDVNNDDVKVDAKNNAAADVVDDDVDYEQGIGFNDYEINTVVANNGNDVMIEDDDKEGSDILIVYAEDYVESDYIEDIDKDGRALTMAKIMT